MFNNKNLTRDPVTGELLAPGTPFHTTVQGLPGFHQDTRHAAADARPAARVRHHRTEYLLGERVDHQWLARCRRGCVPDRLDHVRQAVRLLPARQLRHHVFLDPVSGL
jgi:hypothetical protein